MARPRGLPSTRPIRCTMAGGNGRRTVSKCAFAITASRSGFGMPFRFVLPSAARANIVSSSASNWRAGRTSQTKWASSSPAFQNLCGVPAGTVMRWPGPATSFLRPIRKPTLPRRTSKRSSWLGCTCAAATKPFGCTKVSITTAWPFVSRLVCRKTMRSPVTGFSMVSPARIIWGSFGSFRGREHHRSGRLRSAWGPVGKGVGTMEFRILGSIEVIGDDGPLRLGAPKQRALLAFLLLNANKVVSRDSLVDALWGAEPPRSAVSSLQVYVPGLRRALGGQRIERHATGYRLHLDPSSLDLSRFERLVDRAAVALGAGRAADAA